MVALTACTQSGRPAASGLPGVVVVFGQEDRTPVKLEPAQPRLLATPQRLAFAFSCTGTGPRDVRIEMRVPRGDWAVLFETRVSAPMAFTYFDYLLELGDETPARFDIKTVIESPHDQPISAVYPLALKPGPKGGLNGPAPRGVVPD